MRVCLCMCVRVHVYTLNTLHEYVAFVHKILVYKLILKTIISWSDMPGTTSTLVGVRAQHQIQNVSLSSRLKHQLFKADIVNQI